MPRKSASTITVRPPICPSVRTPRSRQATPAYAPPDLAGYRWLLRRLFANDRTPPRLDTYYESRAA